MSFALLQMINRQLGYFVTTKAASKQDAEQRTVAFALKPFRVRGPKVRVPLQPSTSCPI
jgi:hypothetical protein